MAAHRNKQKDVLVFAHVEDFKRNKFSPLYGSVSDRI